ncbi:MAG: AMP-binding protein [Planctomycetes bacterium]|nr:AMP-binding protein [Planctomycetota bacterium]
MPESVNVANRLRRQAQLNPDKQAIVLCKGPGKNGLLRTASHTFAELERDSDAAARGMLQAGIGPRTKTLVMVRPSLPFFSCFFALFKIGAIPVFIDPGMGGKRLLECVRNLAPEAMIGIPPAHMVRVMFKRNFPGFRTAITVGRRWFWGGKTWDEVRDFADQPFPIAPTDPGDLAAILFTTGSTGPAKGVEYSHAALDKEVSIIAETFNIGKEDKDCATFPGFSLFSVALGMTAVIPDMSPVRPGSVYPPNVIVPVNELGCTFSFGSPALWNRVSAYAHERGISMPGLKRVVMAGAPVPVHVHRRLLGGVLPEGGETYTPYGATEVMPVACISGSEVLAETAAETAAGGGVCVGYPAPGARVEIISITDSPIYEWDESLVVPAGQVGEIAVKADYASRHYHNLTDADDLAKIADGPAFWHRMGDVGRRDEKGRIWFYGRKAHRVRTINGDMFTIPVEAIFNRHRDVARSALVGVPDGNGYQRPVVAVELAKTPNQYSAAERARIHEELLELRKSSLVSERVGAILFHPGFPTDIRHNAKIRREDLALWAALELGLA